MKLAEELTTPLKLTQVGDVETAESKPSGVGDTAKSARLSSF
jgi:hypothetical protein